MLHAESTMLVWMPNENRTLQFGRHIPAVLREGKSVWTVRLRPRKKRRNALAVDMCHPVKMRSQDVMFFSIRCVLKPSFLVHVRFSKSPSRICCKVNNQSTDRFQISVNMLKAITFSSLGRHCKPISNRTEKNVCLQSLVKNQRSARHSTLRRFPTVPMAWPS